MNPQDSVLTLTEWKTGEVAGKTLSPQDRKLVTQVAGEAGRLHIDELRSGIRVQATSWVGVVHFEQFSVQITPKLAGGNLGLVELLAWTTGLEALRRNQGIRTLALAQHGHLFDLIALLFAETCAQIVRSGLLHDYVEREDDLPVLRGRLLTSQQVRRRFGRVDRLECCFDDHTSDVRENQILAAVLGLCRSHVQHPHVRQHIHRLHSLFASVCPDLQLDLTHVFEDVSYHRLNEHYCEAHHLARLIVDGLQVRDLFAAGQTRSFAFLLDMNRLFESFSTKIVTRALAGTGYRLHQQHQDHTVIWSVNRQQPYTYIRPDIVVESLDGQRLAIDAKYKRYDEHTIASSDLYQSFLYAHAYSAPKGQPAHALLLYPGSGKELSSLHLQIREHDLETAANLYALGLPIPQLLQEVRLPESGPIIKRLATFIQQRLGS